VIWNSNTRIELEGGGKVKKHPFVKALIEYRKARDVWVEFKYRKELEG